MKFFVKTPFSSTLNFGVSKRRLNPYTPFSEDSCLSSLILDMQPAFSFAQPRRRTHLLCFSFVSPLALVVDSGEIGDNDGYWAFLRIHPEAFSLAPLWGYEPIIRNNKTQSTIHQVLPTQNNNKII
ncbi:hypothetical protein CEXT_528201 [Caerostris extrusa]|uniref:Uncharacterized protein n=1 Tax=Caerostris extrusa TaxID=172846 RepID=A0AAV4U8U2_CAEEX|nr:hypothetical protein CEXT_528201 [Caerostris extrusa]